MIDWKPVGTIIAEGGEISLNGLNPWEHTWIDAHDPPITVHHPQYPGQTHKMNVYEISDGQKTVKFAAGEFSNAAWGFYLPTLN